MVASHLLSEIERVCDHLVAVEGGKLLRADSISSFTRREPGTARRGRLRRRHRGADRGPRPARPGAVKGKERYQALVPLSRADGSDGGDGTFDVVRDAVADLRLPLSRLEQRRHQVEELFRDENLEGVAGVR